MEGEAKGLPYPRQGACRRRVIHQGGDGRFTTAETAGAQGRRSREDSWSESGQQGEYADHTETEKLRRSGQKEKALPSTLDKLT